MRATLVLFFLAPCVIAANQPTFTYALPANTSIRATVRNADPTSAATLSAAAITPTLARTRRIHPPQISFAMIVRKPCSHEFENPGPETILPYESTFRIAY